MALLERFYEPLDGLVLLDDTDLSTYDPSWLHSQIAYASQVQDLGFRVWAHSMHPKSFRIAM